MLSMFIFFLILNLRCRHIFTKILWAKRSIFCCQQIYELQLTCKPSTFLLVNTVNLPNPPIAKSVWGKFLSPHKKYLRQAACQRFLIFPFTLQIDNIDRLRAVLYWNGGVHIHAERWISACYLLYCWGPRVSLPLKHINLLCPSL